MAGGKHADADVCSQSACCQACLSADALQERYGAAFDAAWDKASNAVQQTQDEVLTYGGALIDAVYFSCSGGSTEAAAAVWARTCLSAGGGQPRRAGRGPVCEHRHLLPAEFAETLGLAADGDPAGWLGGTSYTAGGGVDTCTIQDRPTPVRGCGSCSGSTPRAFRCGTRTASSASTCAATATASA